MSTAEYKGHHESHTPYAKGWLPSMYLAFVINAMTAVLLAVKGFHGWAWVFIAYNVALLGAIAYVHIARIVAGLDRMEGT